MSQDIQDGRTYENVGSAVRHFPGGRRRTSAEPGAVWDVISQIGGANGWYSASVLWAIRGWLDRLGGGAGLQRGRRNRSRVAVGDAIDVWRVEKVEPGPAAAPARSRAGRVAPEPEAGYRTFVVALLFLTTVV